MTTNQTAVETQEKTQPKMSSFERNLTWWVLACVVTGIALGKLAPALFQAVASIKLAEVNLVVV